MKSVLISIHPAYCELIAVGDKELEIRKRCPRIPTPFKCYIYQSKHRWVYKILEKLRSFAWARALTEGQGKVIGEFVCDGIRVFDVPYPAFQNELDKSILEQSCLTYYQLHRYAYHDNLCGWHISDLKIYDKPKELGKLIRVCSEWEKEEITQKCHKCDHYFTSWAECYAGCDCDGELPVTRPPQSWCYVEELNDE